MNCSTTDQQSPDLRSESSDKLNIVAPSVAESSETDYREEHAYVAQLRQSRPALQPPEPRVVHEPPQRSAWSRDKEMTRQSCSKERPSAAIERLASVKESVQDCESFNELLKEKLASIESKLKCKNPN